jgi:NitT/TauT family transport system permease protein
MNKFLPLVPAIVVVLALELLSRTGVFPDYLFPAPSAMWKSFVEDRSRFISVALETLLASAVGFSLSVGVGLLFSAIIAASKTLRSMVLPYAVLFQTVPIIAIAPLLVIWFGYGLPTVVAASFIASIFPIIANTVSGLLSTDPTLLSLFRVLRATRFQTIISLRLPYALPSILTGFRVSSGLAVIGAIVGEFVSGTGLGGLIDESRTQQRVDRVFIAVLLGSLIGIAFFGFVQLLSKIFLSRWIPEEIK